MDDDTETAALDEAELAYLERRSESLTGLGADADERAVEVALRPRSLDEVIGQEHLTGPEGAIGRMVAAGRLSSMILWGPPGTGKTSIARLLADAVPT